MASTLVYVGILFALFIVGTLAYYVGAASRS